MEMECLDFRFYYKKMMSLESSRVNVGNIYLLLTVCVILYIGRMLFKNKTETKSFETNETFADINMKICPYLVKKYFIVSHLRFTHRRNTFVSVLYSFIEVRISSCIFMYTFDNENSLKGKIVLQFVLHFVNVN